MGIICTRVLTTGEQLIDEFAHAVSEYVADVGGETVMTFVAWPPGLQEKALGAFVQFAELRNWKGIRELKGFLLLAHV